MKYFLYFCRTVYLFLREQPSLARKSHEGDAKINLSPIRKKHFHLPLRSPFTTFVSRR